MNKKQTTFKTWNIHKKRKLNSLILNLFLLAGAIITIFPLVWMFVSSVKPMKEIIKMPPDFFPKEPTFGNFITLFETLPFLRFLVNSVIVTVISTLILVFVCALAGFVFAKFNFTGKKILYSLILLTMMIVDEVLVLPLFMMITEVQLNNTFTALILPFLATGFGVFLMRQFIASIPSELIEAATIDGASYFKIFARIIIPLVKPALSSLTIFNFIWMWNMLMWPVVVVDSESMMTLQIAMSRFTSMYMTRYDLTMAAATVATIPVLIIYIVLQKNFVKGIALTGLKQ